MSWAEEDWTVGLTGRVLLKVKELQIHQDRLSRENKQKQLQLDNIHISLEKQTVKYEEVRTELQCVRRDLQSVQSEAKVTLNNNQRLSQEIQTKQAQVCSLEGQLESARTLNNKLTQEVKRLEAELEKLQNSSRVADVSLFSTPCWNTTSPWEQNGSQTSDRQRDEGSSRMLHSRQRLHFSDAPASSSLRQQNKSTPQHHASHHSESFSTPLAAFPWEREDSRPPARRLATSSPKTPVANTTSHSPLDHGGPETDFRTHTDISEIQTRVSELEKELSVKTEKLKTIQNELGQNKKKMDSTEVNLQRARDELSMAHTRIAKEGERASGAEQRLKQLQEELKCQRQNYESSRLQQQQRSKELEKQHQRDLMELQKERQCLERQHQQEVNKLNQELQQARTLHNSLQAQADKLSLQKQAVEKELDTSKEKLKWTAGQLQESQKSLTQTQAKLTETQREAEGVALSLEQSRKKILSLEEEGRSLTEQRADVLRQLKELQEEKALSTNQQQVIYPSAGQSFSLPAPSSHQPQPKAKRNVANRAKQKEDEDLANQKGEITTSYPFDREPGEGIDSEHISHNSSNLEFRHVEKGNHFEQLRSQRDQANCEMSERKMPCEPGNSKSSETFPASRCEVEGKMPPEADAVSSDSLQKENAMLRSELQDMREELQKRLEDLEAQRRAETEARTRLRQLSRKNASRAVEKEEQERELKTLLERERAETEKLKKTLTDLETEMKRMVVEQENNEKEPTGENAKKAQEDRECEIVQLNIELKKQLSEVKVQLALERELKEREEQERSRTKDTDKEKGSELNLKLAELQAEIERLKSSQSDVTVKKEKVAGPLTYLTLHSDELNCMDFDNKLLPSPEQHRVFCNSANLRNTLVSQTTEGFIQKKMINSEALLESSGETEAEDASGSCESASSDGTQSPSDLHTCDSASSDIFDEMERLRKEYIRESERAKKYQAKLKALQNQVTSQTQQLTAAFENQSQHITGLLAELQVKDSAFQSQGEELQICRKRLNALQSELSEKTEKEKTEEGSSEVKLAESLERQPNGEKDASLNTNVTSTSENKAGLKVGQIFDLEPQVSMTSADEARLQVSLEPFENISVTQEVNASKAATTAACLDQQLTSRLEENHHLKRALASLKTLDTKKSSEQDQNINVILSNKGRVRDDVTQNTSLQQDPQAVAGEPNLTSQLQLQVVALQNKLAAVSKDAEQQAAELSVWRLASQTVPPLLLHTNYGNEEQTHIQVHGRPDPLGPLEDPPGHLTIIREDELLLSCSSNKLQGRKLFSRVQQSTLSDIRQPKTSAEEIIRDMTDEDKESEKENQESNVLQPSGVGQLLPDEKQHIDPLEMSSERISLPLIIKVDPKNVNSRCQVAARAAECHMERLEAESYTSCGGKPSNKSDGDNRVVMRDVCSQTEEPALELHSVHTQTVEGDEDSVESPTVSPVPPSVEGAEDKMLFSGSFPIPADPVRLAERIRRNRTQLSAAYDDTEYEPYGLPEVVMKGFADIPSGPSCPYIVRRGLLGTAVVPAPQKTAVHEEETD
ncbi:uncharacterized protein ACB058_012241 isoform 1-T2 [Synchiropus picturatus]